MNAREVERELTVVLHRQAEDAMNRTNTHDEHQKLQAEVEDAPRRGRRRWVVGAVAAGIAAAVAFALWPSDFGDRANSGPAGKAQTTEEEVAQGFVEAVAGGDAERIASYLAPAAMADWREQLRQDEAWSREYLLKPCQKSSTAQAGTTVICYFDMRVFHSEQLGLGPFTDNSFTVRVKDGRVVSAEEFTASGPDGQEQIYVAIKAWVQENHPGKWGSMSGGPTGTPAQMQRWHRLWKVYSQEYADAMTRKTNDGAASTR